MKHFHKLLFVIALFGGQLNAQWVSQPSGLTAGWYAQFLDAVDTNVVWALAADPANQSTPVQEFTKTIDGGNLWIANPINNAAGLSPAGIYGLNADTAWVAMFGLSAGSGSSNVDVSQLLNDACMANFNQLNLAQSFVPTQSVICGARIFLTTGTGPGNVTIDLYNNLPNAGGTMLATGTVAVTGSNQWAQVAWPSVTITPGNTYYLVFTSTNGGLCIAGSTANPYSGGMVFANNYDPFPTYDYTFETFTCAAPSTGGKILKTVDGGVNWTWQPSAVFAAPAGFPNMVYFWDANNGMCMGDPNGGYFEIYTTADGGTNWVRTAQANIPVNQTGEFGITSVFTANGDSTLWFGTNFGRIYKTTDRGLNWTVATTPYAGSYISDIAFRDANNGIATNGSPGIAVADAIRTTDGGATWTIVPANTAGIITKQLTYVPGTDSTYFLSSPQVGGGTAFSLNDANSWILADNLIHSDIEFVAPTTGWTGSNELNAPMFKWVGPITFSCATLLGPLEFVSSDSICAVDSVVYSIHVDFTGDPQNRLGFNVVFYDELYNQIGSQMVPDFIAAGFPNNFVPDAGQTTIGVLNFTVFFTLAPATELVHFAMQVFPTQCLDDTSNFLYNSVFSDVSTCATTLQIDYTLSLDMSPCQPTGAVNYTNSYSVNGGPPIPGEVFDCIGYTGIVNVMFFIDNGVCMKEISSSIDCTGVGVEELDASHVSVYPNPANDILHISTGEAARIREILITDITGRVVAQMQNLSDAVTDISVPLESLTTGTYMVRINTESGSMIVKRFVKL